MTSSHQRKKRVTNKGQGKAKGKSVGGSEGDGEGEGPMHAGRARPRRRSTSPNVFSSRAGREDTAAPAMPPAPHKSRRTVSFDLGGSSYVRRSGAGMISGMSRAGSHPCSQTELPRISKNCCASGRAGPAAPAASVTSPSTVTTTA